MAQYLQFKNELVPICRQNYRFGIEPIDGTRWDGLIDGETVRAFTTEDEARAWLTKIKNAIEGGDTIMIIDDF